MAAIGGAAFYAVGAGVVSAMYYLGRHRYENAWSGVEHATLH